MCTQNGKTYEFGTLIDTFYGQLKFENDPLPAVVGMAGKQKILQILVRKQLIALQ